MQQLPTYSRVSRTQETNAVFYSFGYNLIIWRNIQSQGDAFETDGYYEDIAATSTRYVAVRSTQFLQQLLALLAHTPAMQSVDYCQSRHQTFYFYNGRLSRPQIEPQPQHSSRYCDAVRGCLSTGSIYRRIIGWHPDWILRLAFDNTPRWNYLTEER